MLAAIIVIALCCAVGYKAATRLGTSHQQLEQQLQTRTPKPIVATSTATPSPSPTPTPTPTVLASHTRSATKKTPVPKSTASNNFGLSVGDTLMGLTNAQLNARLDDMKTIGVAWVRLDLDWNNIQPDNANSYTWSRFDNIVTAANARGLKLLPIITYTPPWARRSDCASHFTCQPTDPNQFAIYAREAVKRYAPRGIHHWEIWNEANSNTSWRPQANVSEYVSLLKTTYPQIKQADPKATIILGGLASTDYNDGGIPQLDYLYGVYQNGGKPYFDAVGYHPYSYPVPTSYNVEWNAWTKIAGTNPSIRSIMTSFGDSAKKIWITEYGAPTAGPRGLATPTDYNLEGSVDHVDEALQAIMATEFVKSVRASSWIAAAFWYSYLDEGTDPSDVEDYFGIIRHDGSHKPAYAAYQRAVTGR